MNLDKKNSNNKKPYLLVDSSYVSFHRFFSTLIWYNNMYPDQEIGEDYEWLENEVFMKHFDETYMKNLLKFKNMYNVPIENVIIIRDCPRETIWRMNISKEYKATRKNTCNYKNKKYNIGNIFKHIYNSLYPQLEKQYGFRIVKVENAEADDIIAVLANKIREMDRTRLVVIISNDNDYLQLVNEKTLIWSLQNKLLNTKVETTAEEILLKKILKGDESDNIPSLVGGISDRDVNEMIKDSRKLNQWLDNNEGKRLLFEENRKLIDFQYIPEEIKKSILEECSEFLPQVEVEVKKQDVDHLSVDSATETIKGLPIMRNRNKIENKIIQPIIKNRLVNKSYHSNYINYRNYGNPHYIKNIGMSCAYYQNRHVYQDAYTINFTDEYY